MLVSWPLASSEVILGDAPCGIAFLFGLPRDLVPCYPPFSKSVIAFAQLPGMRPSKEIRARALFKAQAGRSAYAIVNPSGTQTAMVNIQGIDSAGKVIATASLQIPPLQKVSKFLDELLTADLSQLLPDQDRANVQGSLHFKSDIPIAVGALLVLGPELKFENLSVSSVP